jgi:protein-S-isoprenylcysteine O-methyltransferase Ste14
MRQFVFKNRGALLVPVALVLVIFGRPSVNSAIAGVMVALLGETIRIWAVGYSGVTTRAEIVTAPRLVTAGPYAIVRNPLYLGNVLIALGFWLAFAGAVAPVVAATLLGVVLVLVVGVYAVIVPLEEEYLATTFGALYQRYRSVVPRAVPSGRALPQSERAGTWHPDVIARAEIITLMFFAVMIAAVIARLMASGPRE